MRTYQQKLSRRAAVGPAVALALVLSGCGGGGSGGTPDGGSGSAPPPVAAPPPTPSATLPPAPFGLTTTQQLPVFGWVYRQGSVQPVPVDSSLVDLRWSATARTYEMSLAGIGSGSLGYAFPGNNHLAFKLLDAGGNRLPVNLTLDPGSFFDPPSQHVGRLEVERSAPGTDGEVSAAILAFGFPATPAQMPITGGERYLTGGGPTGHADLRFDFASGTLQGHIAIAWSDAWGPYEPIRYELVDTQYTRGGVGFSARLAAPGAPSQGTLEGWFMGPNASELVIRWQAPFWDPYAEAWTTLSGVSAGKPYCSFFVNTPCV